MGLKRVKKERQEWWRQWGKNLWAVRFELVRGFVLLLTLISAINTIIVKGHDIYSATARIVGPHITQIAIGVLVTVMGVFARRFKLKNLRWYGIVEVMFGIISGFSVAFTLSAAKPWIPQGPTLVGCAYVIARGLNNIADSKRIRAISI